MSAACGLYHSLALTGYFHPIVRFLNQFQLKEMFILGALVRTEDMVLKMNQNFLFHNLLRPLLESDRKRYVVVQITPPYCQV